MRQVSISLISSSPVTCGFCAPLITSATPALGSNKPFSGFPVSRTSHCVWSKGLVIQASSPIAITFIVTLMPPKSGAFASIVDRSWSGIMMSPSTFLISTGNPSSGVVLPSKSIVKWKLSCELNASMARSRNARNSSGSNSVASALSSPPPPPHASRSTQASAIAPHTENLAEVFTFITRRFCTVRNG